MAKQNLWTRDQLLMALWLYMTTTFGQLHSTNPKIVSLAGRIGRTPGALAMKAVNFASIDPKLNRRGLSNSSKADRDIWAEFESNPTQLALDAEDAAARFDASPPDTEVELKIPTGATEKEVLVRVRRVQSFFRSAVMVSYGGRCAITGLAVPELLVASHIIPWSDSETRRADPTNGIFLNALLDRAFDRGFITFDEEFRVIVSRVLTKAVETAALDCSLIEIEGRELEMPSRFKPDPVALAHHRKEIFKR